MAGPLVEVKTQTRGITLDISRQLGLGEDISLLFIIPDSTDPNGWRTLATLTEGFDRVSTDETISGDGQSVVYDVADLLGTLPAVIRNKELHIIQRTGATDAEDKLYKVDTVPAPPENEAQVYRITCKVRTLKDTFFNTRK